MHLILLKVPIYTLSLKYLLNNIKYFIGFPAWHVTLKPYRKSKNVNVMLNYCNIINILHQRDSADKKFGNPCATILYHNGQFG